MDKNWNVRLREIRVKNNISVKEAASFCNLSPQGLNDYEKNKNGISPRVEVLEKLCDLYNCSLSYILYGNESGINLDTELKDALRTLLGLYIRKKALINEDRNGQAVVTITDDWMNKHLHYFLDAINSEGSFDITKMAEIILSIKNVQERIS